MKLSTSSIKSLLAFGAFLVAGIIFTVIGRDNLDKIENARFKETTCSIRAAGTTEPCEYGSAGVSAECGGGTCTGCQWVFPDVTISECPGKQYSYTPSKTKEHDLEDSSGRARSTDRNCYRSSECSSPPYKAGDALPCFVRADCSELRTADEEDDKALYEQYFIVGIIALCLSGCSCCCFCFSLMPDPPEEVQPAELAADEANEVVPNDESVAK
eukprot:gnl/MRDRNA2_/MRDRNA2_54701_c0_seq1.p1 gnl/MRDRNA2_/MRDRNA2_54701_c0~~gnl/MRDRNA2_/MRDRNA2_54701_c0_seq1.p1  ORF type:complete len:214 (+),score=33.71 gnl/MRDRNA2_/MRDRNA2_54701_c0_seq1:115-756(+)